MYVDLDGIENVNLKSSVVKVNAALRHYIDKRLTRDTTTLR